MSTFMIVVAALMYLFMMVMNTLANTMPINGISTGDVSYKYPNLFQPTGLTFSIWGIIYLLLFAYVVFQFTTLGKPMSEELRALFLKVNVLFAISSLFNGLWLLAWHYDKMVFSTVIMVLLLITLALISKMTPSLGLLTRTAFSVYFGWITIATIANVTIMLVKLGVPSFSQTSVLMTVGILVVGLILSGLWIYLEKDIAYGLVILWAYLGIVIRHLSVSELNRGYPLIYTTALVVMGMLTVVSMITTYFALR